MRKRNVRPGQRWRLYGETLHITHLGHEGCGPVAYHHDGFTAVEWLQRHGIPLDPLTEVRLLIARAARTLADWIEP